MGCLKLAYREEKPTLQVVYGGKFFEQKSVQRFIRIDPEAEMLEDYSPYISMHNNPISNTDPLGDFATRFGAWWHRLWNGGGKIEQNEYGEWSVLKSKTETSDDGGVTVTAYKEYGKGRDKYSATREALIRDAEIEADIQINGEKSMFQMYESSEEAGKAALGIGVGLALPNPILKSTTNSINLTQLANKGKKIIQEISKRISVQKQARHLIGTAKQGGGFLNNVDDAQKVLDAVHSGEAVYLGTTNAGQPVFRYSGVTGTNVNVGAGFTGQPTNVFIIKGTTSPTVVPTSPAF